MCDNSLEFIEIWNLQKPSIYTAEIRNRLFFLEGICTLDDLPSIDTINKSLQKTFHISNKATRRLWFDDYNIQYSS